MSKIVKTNEYAPFNAATLGTAKLGMLVLKEGKIGYDRVNKCDKMAVVGYTIKLVTIKELLKEPLYDTFRIHGKDKEYTLSEAFGLIEQAYVGGDLAKGKRLYVKVATALRTFNESKIAELSSSVSFRLNRDAYHERIENSKRHADERVRWDSLVHEGSFTNKTSQELLDKINGLSEKTREVWLMRARDYGLEVPTTTLHRKDVYTMRVAAVADTADSIHPFNTYHPVDETDPVKTFVGRHKQDVQFRQSENEIIAMAMWFAKHGDMFMEKCKPLYDVVQVTMDYSYDGRVFFTGTAAECIEKVEAYRDIGVDVVILPSDKEITVREARLLGVTEDDRLIRRDFCYDANDILD